MSDSSNPMIPQMRVLLVAHAFPPTFGGVETHLWDLSQHLSDRGYTVQCLVGGQESEQSYGAVKVQRYRELSVSYLLEKRSGLDPLTIHKELLENLSTIIESVVSNFSPTLIHLHNAHHFAPELALGFFGQENQLPLLNGVHDRIGEHLYEQVLGYPWAHTIYASNYLYESLPKPKGPCTVLPLGIDLSLFSPVGELDARLIRLERPIIFHPARLLRWKGVEVGLEAFILLRREIGRGTVVLCESSNIVDDQEDMRRLRAALEERARAAGINRSVRFLDFERSEMACAYRACDLVWYPTIDEEPYGLVPIEAMACGVPVIVSDSGGMRETVIPHITGLVVPKNDANALAAAAQLIFEDDGLREDLIEGGKKRAQVFEISNYVTDLEEVYHSSVGG